MDPAQWVLALCQVPSWPQGIQTRVRPCPKSLGVKETYIMTSLQHGWSHRWAMQRSDGDTGRRGHKGRFPRKVSVEKGPGVCWQRTGRAKKHLWWQEISKDSNAGGVTCSGTSKQILNQVSPEQWFSTRVVCAPRQGHLALSGNILGCCTSVVFLLASITEARAAIKHPSMHRTSPMTETSGPQTSSVEKAGPGSLSVKVSGHLHEKPIHL